MAPIGIGLIGLGRHGMRYARHLLEGCPEGRLTAVCRRDVAAGSDFAAQHGLHFHDHYVDLIADPLVDAVVVVTPPALNRPIALAAIQAGKPLLIEKPLAPTGQAAHHIVQTAEAAQVPLMTAQTLRYDHAISTLKAETPPIGPWHYLVLTHRIERERFAPDYQQGWEGRGVLLKTGIHMLDLVRFLTGQEIHTVHCDLHRPSHEAPEDRAWIRLTTHQGPPCLLDISRIGSARVTRAEIIGEYGQLMADWTGHRFGKALKGQTLQERETPPLPTIPLVLDGFLQALIENSPMPISGLDGQRAVEAADACYQSAATGQPVTLDPD